MLRTFASLQVDLQHVDIKPGDEDTKTIEYAWDLSAYYPSVEWDIIDGPARKNYIFYPCCPNDAYPDVTFNLTIKRRTLYYTINLIIPCACINMLTILAFYLPPDADGKKISVCISLLLSLSLFQLLLMDLVPATSIRLSLMGKYLLFTNALITLSVFFSSILININYRSSTTHRMSRRTRWFFLKFLPRYLQMEQPDLPLIPEDDEEIESSQDALFGPDEVQSDLANYGNPYSRNFQPINVGSQNNFYETSFIGFHGDEAARLCQACVSDQRASYPPNAEKALEGIGFIDRHTRDNILHKRVSP